ncbi:MAG: hypothetical protein J5725_08675 [Bacteroidales bacterium]|nr:hypothetical protein [Bacteroidales bacterium]
MQPYYSQPYYNPMLATQQRLTALEQQFPQQPYLKGRPVSSFDEAKAAMIDLDGSTHYFVDAANNAIYSKQINLDGTASINVYKKVEDKGVNSNQQPVLKEEFLTVIGDLQNQINTIMEGMKDDKSTQRKRQPIRSDSE